MALLNKVFGKNEREVKLKQEVSSLELRKESVFAAINVEIANLNKARSNVILQAGMHAYESWCKDKSQAELTEYWGKVQEFEKLIQEQEVKKSEMGRRYDEEINLITNNIGLGNASEVISNTGRGTKQCLNCGAPIEDTDVYCQNCGAKQQ